MEQLSLLHRLSDYTDIRYQTVAVTPQVVLLDTKNQTVIGSQLSTYCRYFSSGVRREINYQQSLRYNGVSRKLDLNLTR